MFDLAPVTQWIQLRKKGSRTAKAPPPITPELMVDIVLGRVKGVNEDRKELQAGWEFSVLEHRERGHGERIHFSAEWNSDLEQLEVINKADPSLVYILNAKSLMEVMIGQISHVPFSTQVRVIGEGVQPASTAPQIEPVLECGSHSQPETQATADTDAGIG